jgi:hypothetical protein
MQMQAQPAADPAQLAALQAKLVLQGRMRSGINWFYWIAGLSLINSGAYLFGLTISFVIGLGLTQLVDGVFTGLTRELGPGTEWLRAVGMFIDLCVAGVFVLIGYLGRKRMRWPVILGLVVYALDAILLLAFKDYFGAAFHAWALFAIWTGLKAMRQLDAQEKRSNPQVIGSSPL